MKKLSSEDRSRILHELVEKARKDPARQQLIARHRAIIRPILDDLREVGFDCDSLDDLRTSRLKYKDAVPVLVSWLDKISDDDVLESLVRTLTVPWAKGKAEDALLKLYSTLDTSRHENLRWAIGNAFEVLASKKYETQLLDIVRNRENSTSRQMFVLGLRKVPGEATETMLIKLLSDSDIQGHAVNALGKLRSKRALTHIEPFLKHENAWIRREAKNALSRINSSTKP